MAAIYQWFPSGRYIDYEFILMSTDQEWTVKYIGYDYNTGIYTDFGSFWVNRNCSVVCDGKNVLIDSGGDYLKTPQQFIFRGTCFTYVAEGTHGGVNGGDQMCSFTRSPRALLFNGVQGFGWGVNSVEYSYDPPYAFSGEVEVNDALPASNGAYWGRICDLNVGNNGLRGYGDQFVVTAGKGPPGTGYGKITTYKFVGGNYNKLDEYETFNDMGTALWGWNHQTGEMATGHWFSNNSRIYFWEVTLLTGEITYIGEGAVVNDLFAVGFSPAQSGGNSYVITAERNTGPSPDEWYLRTYSRSGFALSLVDTLVLPSSEAPGPNIRFETSRISGRIWMMGGGGAAPNGGSGILILDVDAAGQISIVFQFSKLSAFSSGYTGTPIAFLDVPLTVIPNGFAGIKAKLFECWEMSEVGSVNRVGSINGIVFTPSGTVTNRAGSIGNAANLTGASALVCTGSAIPQEMRTQGSFTIICDAWLDTKATTQQIIGRGNIDYYTTNPTAYDFSLLYDQSIDRFVFEIRSNISIYSTNIYTVIAHALGSPAINTKYHCCIEYDKTLDRIRIKINNGADNQTLVPLGTTLNMYGNSTMAITIGRRSTNSPGNQPMFMDGYVDQVFWFWDILTDDEKAWMYNSGNSRAFSEL